MQSGPLVRVGRCSLPEYENFLECLLDFVTGFRLKDIQLCFLNLIVPWFLDESGTLGEVDVLHG